MTPHETETLLQTLATDLPAAAEDPWLRVERAWRRGRRRRAAAGLLAVMAIGGGTLAAQPWQATRVAAPAGPARGIQALDDGVPRGPLGKTRRCSPRSARR